MIGRHQLLQWINTVVQSQYPTIQSLCDGIAYCQIVQAIHPGSINVMKMNLVTKLPIDCEKNLKILQSALKNMGIPLTQDVSKMAQGKFQDNIQFTQWVYNHAKSYGFENLQNYEAYERRLQILKKQKKNWNEVNLHLLPNEPYRQQQNQTYSAPYPGQNQYSTYGVSQPATELQQRIDEISNYVVNLEMELKQKMELNWRTMHMIGRYMQERNLLYSLLEEIEEITVNGSGSPVQKEILRILGSKPEGFTGK